ncbi:peptidase [Edwardsiella tarda ATCC 15947 = NBRC 105688]|uniref:Peptidase n=2 Tax=Edwardsiella tarda TaxID=636 RepID=A0AC61TIH1_EDWTA|nr:peptidase [Edwardsiella tarda]UCQ00300.1 peptidase [Edwardsiella tarda ATCC 15947 = NBRC 105688]
MIRAPALLCLIGWLTACVSTPPAPPAKILCEPTPPSLTTPTPTPPLPVRVTWGRLATWGDSLLDALEACNADKAGIATLEQRRQQRLNTPTRP